MLSNYFNIGTKSGTNMDTGASKSTDDNTVVRLGGSANTTETLSTRQILDYNHILPGQPKSGRLWRSKRPARCDLRSKLVVHIFNRLIIL